MKHILIPILVGLVGGAAIGMQNPLASLMGQRIGGLGSAFVIHLGGTLAAAIALLLIGGGQLGAWRTVPWYALAAGTLGVLFISAIAFTMPRIGITGTIALIIAAQLTIGIVLDHHGLLGHAVRSVDAARIAGMILLLAGTWMVLR